MAEKYKWCANEPVVVGYKDSEGKEYCVFHAPQGQKGIPTNAFNEMVFSRIRHNNMRNFSGTVFEEISFRSFDKNNPLKDIDFSYCTFSGEADFYGAKFSGVADFFWAKFSGRVGFSDATFSGVARFFGATFSGVAKFFGATFSGEANFFGATFRGEANFLVTTFSGEANFFGTTFSGVAHFNRAKFNEKAEFFGETFTSGAKLQNLYIKEKIRFEGVDLRKVEFLNTDLRRIDFTNCDWPRKGKSRLQEYRPEIVYDEIKLYEDLAKKDGVSAFKRFFYSDEKKFKKVESLYRQLKQKCKDDHDEQQASNWHYCEKDVFRKGSLRRRFVGLTALYWASSGYGERVVRSSIVLVLLILGLPLLLAYGGLVPTGDGQADLVCINGLYDIFNFKEIFNFKNYQAIVLNTLQFATFQKVTFFRPNSHLGEWFKVITQILIPLQAALFAFAVRNRFRR